VIPLFLLATKLHICNMYLGLSEFQSEYGGYWGYMMAGCVLTVLPATILVISCRSTW
jgi:ABC-type glycerol-3-phosphate transport system permease component